MKRNIGIIGRASMAGLAAALAGCMTSVRSTWDQSPDGAVHAAVSVLSSGTQSEALAKGFDTGPQGSILEDARGKQDSTAAVAALRDIVVALAPIMAGRTAAPAAEAGDAAQTAYAPGNGAAADARTAYAPDGYTGTPGPAGEGVYGSPACGRCRAYRAAHPDVVLINTDMPGNLADLFAALRLRGYTRPDAPLPVVVTADGYTLSAK